MVLTRRISRIHRIHHSRQLRSGQLVNVIYARKIAAPALYGQQKNVQYTPRERSMARRCDLMEESEMGPHPGPDGRLGHEPNHTCAAMRSQAGPDMSGLREEVNEVACDSHTGDSLEIMGERQLRDVRGINDDSLKLSTPSNSAEMIIRWENTPPIPEEVDLPADGRWDHGAAYESRYCFQLGEDEFHLRTPTRWMRPTDFKLPAAGDMLAFMLEQFNERPCAFNPHSRRHQAECTGRLWSHMDGVTARFTLNDQVLYMIRWKACWTPRSCIDDGGWLGAS